MAGKATEPKADTGKAADRDEARHHGNGAAELAEALVKHLERIGGARHDDEPELTLAQSRLVMHYSALSNSLGNFGRHGASRVAFLSPSPELNGAQDQLTFPGLLEATQRAGRDAEFFVTYDATTEQPLQRDELDMSLSEVVVNVIEGSRIRIVEIEDVDKVPFLLGFVTTPATNASY